MYSIEPKVSSKSEYFFYTPNEKYKDLFLYITAIGKFDYIKEYHLIRNRYDSFLLLFIEKGNMEIVLDKKNYFAHSGEVVFLDCYSPHEYRAVDNSKTLWLHFDGPGARAYYDYITKESGSIITPTNFRTLYQQLYKLFLDCKNANVFDEASISISILTLLQSLIASSKDNSSISDSVKKATSYIAENFKEKISINKISEIAGFSPYYFTRVFKKETGLTPHQYLISTRISAAKYSLASTQLSIEEIASSCGFDDTSAFCYTFRKWEGLTPTEYRKKISQ
ncbi:MAG: AraC family transcriptional regulator [Butyrivibrio sp.]|nr:AraC family transcriptional regulator [Butyrivibrio sp.]